jgi:hypothetical protein
MPINQAQHQQQQNDLKRALSFATSLKTLAVPSAPESEPSSPHTQMSSSSTHIAEAFAGSPAVPEPRVVVTDYVPPRNSKAATTPLPSPNPLRNRQRRGQNFGPPPSNGIKLSPSWLSLSLPCLRKRPRIYRGAFSFR